MAKIRGSGKDNELFGKSANDLLFGLGGDDFIFGGKGNDILNGGIGDDTLVGGAGKDTLIGGPGTDVMTGGAGDDVFRFVLGIETPTGAPNTDVITDFDQVAGAGGDKLQLPSGVTIWLNEAIEARGSIIAWQVVYQGNGSQGFMILNGLQTAPDYEII